MDNNEFSDEQLQFAMKRYLKEKEYRNKYYKNRYLTDEAYKSDQKRRSKEYYHSNKEKIKQKYQENKIIKEKLLNDSKKDTTS